MRPRTPHSPARLLGLLLAGAWTLAILVACLMPGQRVPAPFSLSDKVGHFGLFVGFGVAWMGAFAGAPTPFAVRARRVLLAAVAFALLTEALQATLPLGRSAEGLDGLADVLGAAVGVGLSALVHRRPAVPHEAATTTA